MRRIHFILVVVLAIAWAMSLPVELTAQEAEPSGDAGTKAAPPAQQANDGRAYSGMYTFLKEGEFVQVLCRMPDASPDSSRVSATRESDKGAFLDQFFKTANLDGNKLTFTTEVVHGVTFDFKGTIERGEGKNPGDEAYFVLKGTLTENASDVNKKVTSHSTEVSFKMFPQDASPEAVQRK